MVTLVVVLSCGVNEGHPHLQCSTVCNDGEFSEMLPRHECFAVL